MKYILGRSRPQSRLGQLALVIILAVAPPFAKAGGVDFKQASNKNPALGNVIWINSILQQNNSRYFEGLSTLQRMVLLDIPPVAGGASPNRHALMFSHEASKSGFHAYDFLTSWEQARAASIAYSGSDVFAQLNPDGENLTSGSTGDIIRQLREGPYRMAVSAPTNMGTVESDDVQARADAYAVKFGERIIRLYGNAPILSAELKFTGYSGSGDQFAEYTLIWESASSNLLVEMAGHLAVGGAPGNALGYGPGRGSSSISGGPYHFKLATLDDASLGSQDNQIKGADILIPPPVVQITPSVQSICIGSGTAEFTANVVADGAAPFSYAWTGPNGFTSNTPTISVSAAGTYSVVVTGSNELSSPVVSVVLTVNPLPVVSIKAPVITCSKPQVELVAESTVTNLSYRWSGPGVVSSADVQTVTVNQPGEYSVVATDPNGCAITATVTVLENKVQPVVFAEGGTLTCANPEIRLSASSATLGALFQWSGPGIVSDADTATPRVNKAGTYQVIITDPANGCSASAGAIVTENKTKPEVRLTGGTLTCEHPQISLSAVSSLPDSLFTWNGPGIVSGANSANPVVNQLGDYVVTVMNPMNGCSTVANVLVQENKAAPVVTASGGILTCAQKEIRLSATSSATGAKYLWSGPGIVAGADTPSPTVNKTGEYTVTVQDSGNGCSSTAVAIVTENLTSPLVTATGGTLTCASTEIALHAVCSVADASFRCSGPGILSGAETASPTVNIPGIYLVTVTDPANGCTATASVTVNEDKQSPGVGATGGTLTCANPEVVLNATSSVSGITFVWRGPGIIDGAETSNPKVNKAGEYIVTALNSLNGCSTVTNVVVTENKTAPVVVTAGGMLTCAQAELVLNAASETSGATFSWTGPGIVSGADTAHATVNAPGTYLVTITDPVNGCSSVGTAMVVESKMAPNITAEGGVLTCAQQSLTLRATTSLPNALFKWTGPGIVTGADTANPSVSAPGVYTVVVTDPLNGCSASTTASVTEDTLAPEITTQGAVLTCSQTQAVVKVSAAKLGMAFVWSGPGIVSGAQSDMCVIDAGGVYTVVVTDPLTGCNTTGTASVTEQKSLPVAEITAPNSVRPFSSTNILQATCSKGSALSWKVTGSGWSIGGSCETNQITFSAGCADSSGTFTLLVSSPGGCTNIYDVTLVARAEESQAGEALVSLTQGFYGNSGGAFNETRSPDLITNLLPITVGKRGVRSLTIPKEAARWITARLPAGGGASALPNFGDQILDAATGQTTPALNVSSRGKFVGVLLGQTIALSLNTRLDPDLLNFELQNSFSTQGALPGADHLIGTADDVRDVLGPDGLAATGDELATFAIPPTVLTALDTFSLGRSVSGLLELANRALAGMSLSGASLGDVNAAVDAINRGFDEGRFPAAAPAAPTSSGSNDYQSSSWLGNTPALKMQRGADGTVVASWPAVHTNYVLQTSNPGGTNWSNIATSPVILKNRCFVTNSVTGSIQFFRLIKP